MSQNNDLISRQDVIDALHTWFRDGFDEDKWWNSTHVLAAIEGLPSAQQGYKWETCFDCPLSHGCPKIKGCTNEQAIEYASQIPNDCPLSTQPDHVADTGKKVCVDTISRQAAIEALARMMPRSYTPDGAHPGDEEIFRAQEVFADCIEALEILPSAAPSTAHTTETTAETTAPSTDDWIPVERELPNDLEEVNVTWVNHEPEPYYESIKSKPFTASAVYYEGNWYWYSSICADVLAEYGRNDVDKVDDTIEITAWRPLPEPYQEGGE